MVYPPGMNVTVTIQADPECEDPSVAAATLREIADRIDDGETYGVVYPEGGMAKAYGRFYTHPMSEGHRGG